MSIENPIKISNQRDITDNNADEDGLKQISYEEQLQIETKEYQSNRYNDKLKTLEKERDELMSKSNKTSEDKDRLREINGEIIGLKEKLENFKNKDQFQIKTGEIQDDIENNKQIKSEEYEDKLRILRQERDEIKNKAKKTPEDVKRWGQLEIEISRLKSKKFIEKFIKDSGFTQDEMNKKLDENKDSGIYDAEFEEMSTEAKDEIEKMKPAENKTRLDGIANIGYKISEIKNNAFRGIYSSLSKMSTKSDFLHRYFNSYAGIYDKEFKKAKQKKEQVGKGVIITGSSLGQGAGTLFKYGRVIYDAKDHIGGGLQKLNPFRHITAGAMFAGRSAEAGKDMRFEYDSVKEKTRVEDEEKAMEEALKIYEKVYGKEGIEKFKKGEKASESIYNEEGEIDEKKEEKQKAKFEKAYKDNLPENIKNRLNKMDFPVTKWYEIYFNKSKDTKVYIDRLMKKIDKIDNKKNLTNKEKENKKQALLKSKEALLDDLDKMVGDDGTIDSISYYSRMAEKVSKGVATALIIDSVGRIAKAGWELRHLLDRVDNDNEIVSQDINLSQSDKKVMQNLENLSEEDKEYIDKNGLSAYIAQKQSDEILSSINTEVTTDSTIDNIDNKIPVVDNSINKKKLIDAKIKVPDRVEEVYNPAEIKIKGKIDTLSEAVSKALHSENTTAEVKDNFINKWLDKKVNIDNDNRAELLNKAIRKMSVANMDDDKNNDVLNLIHKGDIVSIDKDGEIKLNAESGVEAEAVSELQLRENWADIEGAKHGFSKDEVSFGGGQDNLDARSYNVEVYGVDVNIDSDGNFNATVEDKDVIGNISKLEKDQTAREFIGEIINDAKAEIMVGKVKVAVIDDFDSIVKNSGLTKGQAEKFEIDFSDVLNKDEKAKIDFVIKQGLIDNPEQAKQMFNLSERAGIEYNEESFINAYENITNGMELREKEVSYIQMLGTNDNNIRANGIATYFGINKNSIESSSIYINKENQLVIPFIGEKSVSGKILISEDGKKVGFEYKRLKENIRSSSHINSRGSKMIYGRSDLTFWGKNPNGDITDSKIIDKIRERIGGRSRVEELVPL